MVSLNDTLYERVCERMKEGDFSEKEINTVNQARDKLRMHTRIGAFAGATATFYMGKSKNFKPLRLLLLTAGGLVFGTQTGFIAGTLAGLRMINGLPNPQRVINVMREIQVETVKGLPSPPRPKIESSEDRFSPDTLNDQYTEKEGWDNYVDNHHEKVEPVKKETKPPVENKPSAWDKIRSENVSNTTWSKIRMEAQKNSMDENQIEKAKAERAHRLRESSEFGHQELPRTREEEIKTPRRRNHFGDLLE